MSRCILRGKELLKLGKDGMLYAEYLVGRELAKEGDAARLSGGFLAGDIYEFFLGYHTGGVQMANLNGESLKSVDLFNVHFIDVVVQNEDHSCTHILPIYLMELNIGPEEIVAFRFEKNGHKTCEAAYHLEQLLCHGNDISQNS